MDELTLEILSMYLPYKLQWIFEGSDNVHEVIGFDITQYGLKIISPYGDYGSCSINDGKPILRPLSDLTKEIEHNGERFVPYYWFGRQGINIKSVKDERWHIVQKLLSWHFDVFGLREKNLCVYYNEI